MSSRPVYIDNGHCWYPRYVAYFGEHARIMRLAFGLRADREWFRRVG